MIQVGMRGIAIVLVDRFVVPIQDVIQATYHYLFVSIGSDQ